MGEVEEFEEQRARLVAVAYRMLGEYQEAEDVVQDAYLRWHAADRAYVRSPAAWLTKITVNLCLNRLDSARSRRETYTGTWLPEPVPDGVLGPLDTTEQRDSVSFALLSLMERLTPPERAAFVLREAFAYTHRDIAETLDITEAGARQLHHRARTRIGSREARFEPEEGAWRRLVERFLLAAAEGDVAGLESVLTADVTAWSDGGGRVSAALRPILGPDKVARFAAGLAAAYLGDSAFAFEDVNGGPALLVWQDGDLTSVVGFDISADGRVDGLYLQRNPEKLTQVAQRFPAPG